MTSLSLDRHDNLSHGAVSRITSAVLSTNGSFVPTLLRVALGVVMLPHGLQKTVGWFGGYGFSATLSGLGIPVALAFLVILAESAGAIALITGFATRIAALGVASVMVGAVVTVHGANGFFMNWGGNQAGEGFEYHILATAIAAALMIAGGGRWSADRALSR
jgi:putative oxidoreductase